MTARVVDLLLDRASADGAATFVTFLEGEREDTLTYGRLLERASASAVALDEDGAGSHVLLVHPNGLQFFADFFGAALSGRVPVPVAPPTQLRQPDGYADHLRLIAERCGATVILTTAGHLPVLADVAAMAGLPVRVLDEAVAPARPYEPAAPADVAFLQFTSGSTTRPRGVRVTHENVVENASRIRDTFELGPDTTICSWLPLFHDMGLVGSGLAAMAADTRLVLMTPSSFVRRPIRWLQQIARFEATHAPSPTFGLDQVVRRADPAALDGIDLRCLRHLILGSDMVVPATVERFLAFAAPTGIRPEVVRPAYGLAETTLLASAGRGLRTAEVSRRALQERVVAPPEGPDDVVALVSCGSPLPGHRIDVVRDDGTPAGAGAEGEIVLAGPSIADGYHGDDERTAEAFGVAPDGMRFLRTGDRGFLRDGELYVSGRTKDMVIVRGRNIHPEDVERSLDERAGVDGGAVVVIGVDGETAEELVVVQEVRADAASLPALAERISDIVVDTCEVRPSQVVFVALRSLPRTSSGKLQRSLCRRLLAEGRLRTLTDVAELAGGKA